MGAFLITIIWSIRIKYNSRHNIVTRNRIHGLMVIVTKLTRLDLTLAFAGNLRVFRRSFFMAECLIHRSSEAATERFSSALETTKSVCLHLATVALR